MAVGHIELIIILIVLLMLIGVPVMILVLVLTISRRSRSSDGYSNLVPCRDCGKLLSPRATSCPHCGAPVAHEPLGKPFSDT